MRRILCRLAIASLAIPLTLSLTVSCGIEFSTDGADDSNDSDDNGEWKFEFEQNGCKTGVQKGTGKANRCKALLNNEQNNYCALQLRQEDYKKNCGELPPPSDNNSNPNSTHGPGPNPSPSPSPSRSGSFCGYSFEEAADANVVKASLEGPWVTRRSGVMTDRGPAGDRTFKEGFYFGFGAGEISQVKVYHQLNGTDLRAVAISMPERGKSVSVSGAVESGEFVGWRLVQWQNARGACYTVGVGVERQPGATDHTLYMIGPVMVSGSGAVSQPGMSDFFKQHSRRDTFSRESRDLPRWE